LFYAGLILLPLMMPLILSAQTPWQSIHVLPAADIASHFKTPPPEYGMTVWWGWDGLITAEVISRDLDAFRARGIRVVTIEAGYGMKDPYLSPGWFGTIKLAIEQAKQRGMRVWLVDEGKYPVNYDVIGQSYYPWWHGTLNDLRDNLIFMSKTYDKDIMIVEAAYNWAPAEYLNSPAPFPESPEGQKEFLEEVNRAVMATPNGRGIGVFYWEPGVAPRSRGGSAGGRGFFGPDGNALPVMTVFDKFTRGRPQQPAKKMQ
jgi:hypothetical protein